jgi:vacuolar iron transporter family protein
MAEDIARYKANYQDEIDSPALYRTLAETEEQSQLARVYDRLAEVEEEHARFWEEKLRAAGETIPPHRIGWRSRLLGELARHFGPQFVLSTINAMEQADGHGYDDQEESRDTRLPAQERSHARLLRAIAGPSDGLEGGPWPGSKAGTGPPTATL